MISFLWIVSRLLDLIFAILLLPNCGVGSTQCYVISNRGGGVRGEGKGEGERKGRGGGG